jgi:hypothetical protein
MLIKRDTDSLRPWLLATNTKPLTTLTYNLTAIKGRGKDKRRRFRHYVRNSNQRPRQDLVQLDRNAAPSILPEALSKETLPVGDKCVSLRVERSVNLCPPPPSHTSIIVTACVYCSLPIKRTEKQNGNGKSIELLYRGVTLCQSYIVVV